MIVGASLRKGKTVTCGCGISRYKGYKELSGVFWKNIKGSAKSRKIKFSLTIEEAWDKLERQGFICALTGTPLKISKKYKWNAENNTASLDRIDSSKGYTVDNIQWLHKDVNRMKWNLSEDRFIEICNLVSKRKGQTNALRLDTQIPERENQ